MCADVRRVSDAGDRGGYEVIPLGELAARVKDEAPEGEMELA